MIKFEQSDFNVKKEVLSTKAERKEAKIREEQSQANKNKLRELATEFFNNEIVPLDIPLYEIEEHLPTLLRTLININKAMSTKFKTFLDAKKDLEEISINQLEKYVEKN